MKHIVEMYREHTVPNEHFHCPIIYKGHEYWVPALHIDVHPDHMSFWARLKDAYMVLTKKCIAVDYRSEIIK